MQVLGQQVQRFGGGYASTIAKGYPVVHVWAGTYGKGGMVYNPRILACKPKGRGPWHVLVGRGADASLHYTWRLGRFVELHTNGMDC